MLVSGFSLTADSVVLATHLVTFLWQRRNSKSKQVPAYKRKAFIQSRLRWCKYSPYTSKTVFKWNKRPDAPGVVWLHNYPLVAGKGADGCYWVLWLAGGKSQSSELRWMVPLVKTTKKAAREVVRSLNAEEWPTDTSAGRPMPDSEVIERMQKWVRDFISKLPSSNDVDNAKSAGIETWPEAILKHISFPKEVTKLGPKRRQTKKEKKEKRDKALQPADAANLCSKTQPQPQPMQQDSTCTVLPHTGLKTKKTMQRRRLVARSAALGLPQGAVAFVAQAEATTAEPPLQQLPAPVTRRSTPASQQCIDANALARVPTHNKGTYSKLQPDRVRSEMPAALEASEWDSWDRFAPLRPLVTASNKRTGCYYKLMQTCCAQGKPHVGLLVGCATPYIDSLEAIRHTVARNKSSAWLQGSAIRPCTAAERFALQTASRIGDEVEEEATIEGAEQGVLLPGSKFMVEVDFSPLLNNGKELLRWDAAVQRMSFPDLGFVVLLFPVKCRNEKQ